MEYLHGTSSQLTAQEPGICFLRSPAQCTDLYVNLTVTDIVTGNGTSACTVQSSWLATQAAC